MEFEELGKVLAQINIANKKPVKLKAVPYNFSPVFDYIRGEKKWQDHFKGEAQQPPEVLRRFVESHRQFTALNYKALMRLAILTEAFQELAMAKANTQPMDTFFSNEIIEDQIVPYVYTVPGLEGNQLNVSIGSVIVFTKPDGTELNLEVNDILEDTLLLKPIKKKAICRDDSKGKVRLNKVFFKPNVFGTKCMLFAIKTLTNLDLDKLFPENVDEIAHPKLVLGSPPMELYNKMLASNDEQLKAICCILKGLSSHPYILFGPPGTGKSKTLGESVKQCWLHTESLILVSAPSNAAVDLIINDLLQDIPREQIKRLTAKAREKLIDPKMRDIVEVQAGRILSTHGLRILCGTLQCLGKIVLKYSEADAKRFDYLFVDEAGQATEPELLIPFTGLLKSSGKLILAGDPYQLGPVVKTEGAKYLGLDTSMMKRLMSDFVLYLRDANGNFNSAVITQLVKNYRSHPLLIEVPNRLFYDNKLDARAPMSQVEDLCELNMLPHKHFPVVFHGVIGKHSRSNQVPSLCNEAEIKQVMEYVFLLLQTGKVNKCEIGIITPYKRQAKMIREELVQKNLAPKPRLRKSAVSRVTDNSGVFVGSVDQFQGEERKVIILSTVRSSLSASSLGFVTVAQRFNVAITRAKSLMIVIGDPIALIKDRNWRELICFIVQNGGATGQGLEQIKLVVEKHKVKKC